MFSTSFGIIATSRSTTPAVARPHHITSNQINQFNQTIATSRSTTTAVARALAHDTPPAVGAQPRSAAQNQYINQINQSKSQNTSTKSIKAILQIHQPNQSKQFSKYINQINQSNSPITSTKSIKAILQIHQQNQSKQFSKELTTVEMLEHFVVCGVREPTDLREARERVAAEGRLGEKFDDEDLDEPRVEDEACARWRRKAWPCDQNVNVQRTDRDPREEFEQHLQRNVQQRLARGRGQHKLAELEDL